MRMKTEDLITKDECLTSGEVARTILKNKLPFYIYFLVDPFSFQIKYIGKGKKSKGKQDRCLCHFSYCEKEIGKKASWLRKLKKRNKEPLYVIWEFYGISLEDENRAYRDEKTFIDGFGRKGVDKQGTLLNKSNQLGVPLSLKTTEQFIEEAQEVHGDLYGYSQSDYKL